VHLTKTLVNNTLGLRIFAHKCIMCSYHQWSIDSSKLAQKETRIAD